jgi:predicted membrane protein
VKRVIEMTNYRYRNLRIFFVVFAIVFALGTFMNWVDSRIGINSMWLCLGLNYLIAYLSEKQERSFLKYVSLVTFFACVLLSYLSWA